LIFRNDAAEDGANLMSVSSITFSAEVTEKKKADGPNQNL
jgi:hypothetical protein